MRIINISLTLLLVLGSSGGSPAAATKGLPDGSSGEATQIPEASDVGTKNSETDPVNDVAGPQLPKDRTGPLSPPPINPKMKRCARRENVRSRHRSATLSLARRDVTQRQIQRCEECRNGFSCRKYNMCTGCNIICSGVTTPQPPRFNTETVLSEEPRREAQGPEVVQDVDDTPVIVSSRFGEEQNGASQPVYYSLGSVGPGVLMRLFTKIFTVPSPDNFEELVVLGRLKNSQKIPNLNHLVIIDLAQAFGRGNKSAADVHHFESPDSTTTGLVENLDKRLGEAIAKKMQEANDNLSMDEVNKIVDQVMRETSQNVGLVQEPVTPTVESGTRCSVDEAMEDLLDVIPSSGHKEKPQQSGYKDEPQAVPEEDSSEEIKNPPVIQDNLGVLGKSLPEDAYVDDNEEARANVPLEDGYVDDNEEARANVPLEDGDVDDNEEARANVPLEDGYIDDNEEARPIVINENKSQPPLQDAKKDPVPKETVDSPDKQVEVFGVSDAVRPLPNSESQVTPEPGNVQNEMIGESAPESENENLEESVLKIVEDSLKTASDGESALRNMDQDEGLVRQEESEPIYEEFPKENQANSESNMKVFEQPEPKPQMMESRQGDLLEKQESDKNVAIFEDNDVSESKSEEDVGPPVTMPTTRPHLDPSDPDPELPRLVDPPMIIKMPMPEVENRGQSPDSASSEERSNYFGALVPAKNSGVTDSRMKKLYYVGKDINLPLKMFQDENGVLKLRVDTDALCNCKNKNCTKAHIGEDLERKIVERDNGVLPELQVNYKRDQESVDSRVVKRSPKVDSGSSNSVGGDYKFEDLKEELENEIEKLDENIDKYKEENRNWLNKGTVALFKEVEKAKEVDDMITLANSILSWMKDLATKHLSS